MLKKKSSQEIYLEEIRKNFKKMKKKIYSYFDKTINFNFITRYLHNRKYLITKKILCEFSQSQKINILDIGCGSASMYEHLKDCSLNFNYIGVEPDEDLFNEAHYYEEDDSSHLNDKGHYNLARKLNTHIRELGWK